MGTRAIIIGLLLALSPLAEAQFSVGNPGFAADISRRSNLKVRLKMDDYNNMGFNSWHYHQTPFIITGTVFNAFAGGDLVNALFITNRVGEDYLYRPLGGIVDSTNDITIGVWVYPFASLTNGSYSLTEHAVWSMSAPGGFGRTALYVTSNSVSFQTDGQSGGGNQFITRNISLNVSNWNFIAAGAYKLTTLSDNSGMFVYVNGQLFATNRVIQELAATDIMAVGGAIFGSGPTVTNKFQGLTDELIIYAKGLRPEELNWIYNNNVRPRNIGNSEAGELFEASLPPGGNTNEWYISTTGNDANSGTNISQPKTVNWLWTRAGTGKTDVQPGDTVFFRGGTYTASIPTGGGGPTWWTNLTVGTPTLPVTIRNWNNERVILYGYTNLTMLKNQGKWTRLIGFEFWSDNPIKYNPGAFGDSISVGGYNEAGFTNTVANCVFHGIGNCIGQNSPSVAGTNGIYEGNVFYMNGWVAFSGGAFVGSGYPLYARNDDFFKGGPTLIKQNLFGPNFSYAVHGFSSGTDINADMHAVDNAVWSHGSCSTNHRPNQNTVWLTQVSKTISNFVWGGNVFYTSWTNGFTENIVHGRDTDPGPVIGLVFTNNWIHGGSQTSFTMMHNWTNTVFTNNVMIGPGKFTRVCGALGTLNQTFPGPPLGNYIRSRNTYFAPSALSASFLWSATNGNPGAMNLNLSDWQAGTGLDAGSTITATPGFHTNSVCWKNNYEANRANIMIVNANNTGTRVYNNYDVDVSNTFANGTVVNVRFACNFYQSPPHAIRTVTAGKITVPMTNLVVETPIYHNRLGEFYTPSDEATNGTVAGFVLTTW